MRRKKLEEEEENNAREDVHDDDNYDNKDKFCDAVDEEDYHLCSGCDEKPIAHLVKTCGLMICTNCVKKNKCQFRGCRIFNNEKIDFDNFK